jgi:hypothetical protein
VRGKKLNHVNLLASTVPAKDPSHGTGPRFSLGPWAGSLDLGTHRNYPRPYWTYTFDLYFSRDLPLLNSTS